MTRFLIEADGMILGFTSRAVSAACRTTGRTPPFFMALWRVLFVVAVFLLAVAVTAFEPSAFTLALLAVTIVFIEMFRKGIVSLWADGRKEWDARLFRRYAAIAAMKREEFFGLRIMMDFIAVTVTAGALACMAFEVPDGVREAFSLNLCLVWIVLVGGCLEACDPPLPEDGDAFILLSHASA